MSLPTQTKVLRAIQEGEIQRVGGTATLKVNVRLLAATNKDLETMVAERRFREDLFYRLNVFRIRLPALRERREDVPLLADYMLQRLAAGKKSRARRLSPEALERLVRHEWPGNVRELENVLHRACVLAKGETILAKDLPADLLAVRPAKAAAAAPASTPAPAEEVRPAPAPAELSAAELIDRLYAHLRQGDGRNLLGRLELELIDRALAETRDNHLRSSLILGINRSTLKKRLQEPRAGESSGA